MFFLFFFFRFWQRLLTKKRSSFVHLWPRKTSQQVTDDGDLLGRMFSPSLRSSPGWGHWEIALFNHQEIFAHICYLLSLIHAIWFFSFLNLMGILDQIQKKFSEIIEIDSENIETDTLTNIHVPECSHCVWSKNGREAWYCIAGNFHQRKISSKATVRQFVRNLFSSNTGRRSFALQSLDRRSFGCHIILHSWSNISDPTLPVSEKNYSGI